MGKNFNFEGEDTYKALFGAIITIIVNAVVISYSVYLMNNMLTYSQTNHMSNLYTDEFDMHHVYKSVRPNKPTGFNIAFGLF